MANNKNWTGRLTLIKTIDFCVPGGRMKAPISGKAHVYGFEPDDPQCKVNAVATFTGVDVPTVCGRGGEIGEAILRTAMMWSHAKNSGVNGTYDTFPDPVGCPAARIEERSPEQSLVFYRR